jgi:hypothetical protein
MEWHFYVAEFFAGAFLFNAVPHFVKGICGDKFPTPFAKPPGKGLSSSTINAVWGLFNLVVGYILFRAGHVSCDNLTSIIVFFIGGVAMTLMLANHFQHKDKE